jgi:hypothetical protein
VGNKDSDYWSGLARSLISPIAGESWLSRPEETSSLLEHVVERQRLIEGQEEGLKNALILMRAALTGCSPDRAASRLMLLSVIVAALKIAALLGHPQAHKWILAAIEELHKGYPSDHHVLRVLLCCRAINVFHYSARTPGAFRKAIELHAQESILAEESINERAFANDWPIIYREVRGAVWNLMNVRLEAGLGIWLPGRFFQQHLEWQALTEENLPLGFRLADNPSLAIETAAYNVRLRAGVLLDRPNRNHSLRSGSAEHALHEIDVTLDSSLIKAYINQLTEGHLLGLRAEALLCLYDDDRRPNRKEEYVNSRNAALNAYRSAGDQANSDIWGSRLKVLERAAGI